MRAYIFPGQGSQFVGMARELYDGNGIIRELFNHANDLLGIDITSIMFHGPEDELKRTEITQPAIFLHSIAEVKLAGQGFKPDMVAGHSLGEFSALVANGTLSFEDGLQLVRKRALAMQDACNAEASTMAAIIGLEDEVVANACAEQKDVVPANFNCPGQVVISGAVDGVGQASIKLKEAGARLTVPLKVAGAFHSPFMAPAGKQLESAIEQTAFNEPICPIYQNVNGKPVSDPADIKANLIAQLTKPVLWTLTIENMIRDRADKFTEMGPGKVLQGLVKKIDRSVDFV